MILSIQNSEWATLLESEMSLPYFQKLTSFLNDAYKNTTVYPKKEQIFSAYKNTSFSDTNVVILGQDPYHGPYQAHGLSFSVASLGAKFPPSLRNIFKELESDLSIHRTNTNLTDWSEQGVFLLNTVLTVESNKAGSHRKQGWEKFTDKTISLLNHRGDPVIFVLWGKEAQQKTSLITEPQHHILSAPHPSPLSAYHGFFGTRPFSKINELLKSMGKKPINFGNKII